MRNVRTILDFINNKFIFACTERNANINMSSEIQGPNCDFNGSQIGKVDFLMELYIIKSMIIDLYDTPAKIK